MLKGNVGLIFTRMKDKGIITPDKALDRGRIAELTGLSEQQVSTGCHNLAMQQKILGRNKVKQSDDTVRYVYWVMREPNGRKRRRRVITHQQAAATPTFARTSDYKIRIDGPEMLLEKTVSGGVIRAVLDQLIK